MSARDPRLWIGILSALAVALFALADVGRSAPGPVAAVHGNLPAMHGGQSCRQCHGGLFSTMTAACLECHAPIAEQLEAGRGVHGRLGAERAGQCALCHSEHHGEEFALVNATSFAQAGLGDPASFDHAKVGFAMAGRHLELACARCHVSADVPVLREGERRYIGLSQDCASCHHDPHGGRMRVGCADCHGQESFALLAAPNHAAVLPLEGGHARLGCADCHVDGSAHALAAVGERRAPSRRGCADCHASPHRDAFVAAAAQPGRDACATCHLAGHDTFAAAAAILTREQHAHAGFALAAPHDDASCGQCHVPGGTFAERHPGRGPDDCRACHGDPHGGQFDGDRLAASGCVSCHARTHFLPHEFTVEKHAHAGLALTGSHLQLDCERCHVRPGADEPRVFRGTTTQCDGCHSDAHDGFFAAASQSRAPTAHGQCAHCHAPTSFAEPLSGFDHGAWTGHPLVGSHAEAECTSCHRPARAKDAHGRTFGRVADAFPPADGCARCHADPHGGHFDHASLPAEVDGRAGCARCHDETSFRAMPHGFDHGKWTGFPLEGSHAKVACSACHEPTAAHEGGRSMARARGNTCAACHADPHGGQFATAGRTDCARCHKPGHFRSLVFNHNLDSRFRLGDAHAGLACSACHKRESIGGRELVRYRPLPSNCVDCHGMHEDQLRRRRRRGT